jgi:hypothetical protein
MVVFFLTCCSYGWLEGSERAVENILKEEENTATAGRAPPYSEAQKATAGRFNISTSSSDRSK